MEDLTFGEQVKIILGRKGMTIKQLAELIEEKTGKKMSRQNLTQRLGRDNFQEQDMRMIADILECPFRLSILSVDVQPQRSTAALERAAAARTEAVEKNEDETASAPAASLRDESVKAAAPARNEPAEAAAAVQDEPVKPAAPAEELNSGERDMTIGELYDMHVELTELEENAKAGEPIEEIRRELEKPKKEGILRGGLFLRRKQNKDTANTADREEEKTAPADSAETETEARKGTADNAQDTRAADTAAYAEPEVKAEDDFEPVIPHNDAEEDMVAGEVNPYTGREYQSNSVRMHPTRIGYVQVYDRTIHKWTDMTEWAFLGLQERKKALLGKAYEPPIYLD